MTDVITLLPLAAITATGHGAGVDIEKYQGKASVLLVAAAPSAGTAPTLDIVVQTSVDAPHVTSATYVGTGNGKIEAVAGPDPAAENITFTASSATEFAVAGTVSGAIGTATVGTRFESAQINALITKGSVNYATGGVWTVVTTARTWVALAAFTGLTSTGISELKFINTDSAGRFVRAAATIGGTDSPSYEAAVIMMA